MDQYFDYNITPEEIDKVISQSIDKLDEILKYACYKKTDLSAVTYAGLTLAGMSGTLGTAALIVVGVTEGLLGALMIAGGVGVFGLICILPPLSVSLVTSLIDKYTAKKQRKIESFLKYNSNLINEISSKINKDIINEIAKNIKNKNELDKIEIKIYSKKEYNKCIKIIINRILLNKKLLNKLKKVLIQKIHILILGSTGVGKSTLINEFLKLKKEERAKEGVTGDPTVTEDFKEYSKEKDNTTYVLHDTQGILKDGELNINKRLEFICGEINKRIEEKNPNNFIHCIWYCLTGSNIEESELKFITKLLETYNLGEKLPVILLHTKTLTKSDSNIMKKRLIKEFKEDYINKYYINILAREDKDEDEGIVFKQRGMEELKELTYSDILNKAKKTYHLSKLKELINELLDGNCLNMFYKSKKIQSYLKEKSEDLKNGKVKFDDVKNIFNEIINNYAGSLSNKEKNDDNKIIEYYFNSIKKAKDESDKTLEKMLNAENILEKYNDLILSEYNKNNSEEIKTFEEFKDLLKDAHLSTYEKNKDNIINNYILIMMFSWFQISIINGFKKQFESEEANYLNEILDGFRINN